MAIIITTLLATWHQTDGLYATKQDSGTREAFVNTCPELILGNILLFLHVQMAQVARN